MVPGVPSPKARKTIAVLAPPLGLNTACKTSPFSEDAGHWREAERGTLYKGFMAVAQLCISCLPGKHKKLQALALEIMITFLKV